MPKTIRKNAGSGTPVVDGPDGHFEPLETDGSADISFVTGTKEAPTSAEMGETDDEKRARITERDLVWPGKTETIHIGNPENIDYRFDLTVTDLDSTLYVRRPPVGGTTHPQGGVILKPNEQAKFEITFLNPTAEAPALRNFSLVLTMFDVRRTNDPGEIVDTRPLRWVPLPKAADLQIVAEPAEVEVRPWRRNAAYRLRFVNKSYLPPTVELRLLRAETKEALAADAESVGSLSQALPARTSVVWNCAMGPFAERASYYATATGTARVADRDLAISVAKPVHVKYVPWLKVWKDWAFLGGAALFLFWAAWGFPVLKRPTVMIPLTFAGFPQGKFPPGASIKDLTATLVVQDANHQPISIDGRDSLTGAPSSYPDKFGRPVPAYAFVLPARWYGFRWAFGKNVGWNGLSTQPYYLLPNVAPLPDKAGEFSNTYNLDGKYYTASVDAAGPGGDMPVVSVLHSPHVLGDWKEIAPYTIPRANGVQVIVPLAKFTAADVPTGGIQVHFYIDGQAVNTPPLLPSPDARGKLKIETDLLDSTNKFQGGGAHSVTVNAVTDTLESNIVTVNGVQPQAKPITFPALTFHHLAVPTVAGAPGATGAPGAGGGGGAAGGGGGGAPGVVNNLPPPTMPVAPLPVSVHPGGVHVPPAPPLPHITPNPPIHASIPPPAPVVHSVPSTPVTPPVVHTIPIVPVPHPHPAVFVPPVVRPTPAVPVSQPVASNPNVLPSDTNPGAYDSIMRGDYPSVLMNTAGHSDVPSMALRAYALFEVPGADTREALKLVDQTAGRANGMDPTDRAYALTALSRQQWARKHIQEAITTAQQAVAADPNLLWAKVALARVEIYADPGAALQGLKAAIDQAKVDPAQAAYVKPMKGLYRDLYNKTQ